MERKKKDNNPISSKRILLSGASGLIGSALAPFLRSKGHEVIPLARKGSRGPAKAIFWDPDSGQVNKEDFEDFDAIIHLAGKNISSGLWSEKLKSEIFLSRARDSWFLSQVLLRLKQPPKTLVCASAIGIYGNRGNEQLTESSPLGKGFLAEVCKKWEKSTLAIEEKGVRGVHARFGVVVSSKGGMLKKMIPLYKLGLGAILGNGQQMVSWIDIEDVVRVIEHCLSTDSLEGGVNVCAPTSVTQEEFSKALAKLLKRPHFLRVGEKPLRFLFKEMADEMLLASTNAYPQKLLDSGFVFSHPTLEQSLRRNLVDLK